MDKNNEVKLLCPVCGCRRIILDWTNLNLKKHSITGMSWMPICRYHCSVCGLEDAEFYEVIEDAIEGWKAITEGIVNSYGNNEENNEE